jgi:hypothetical protein
MICYWASDMYWEEGAKEGRPFFGDKAGGCD